ncbi:Deleted in azoospermia-like [Lonchura striata]|uniref:Deleted in azoospermia-like n=1 Tax=Lonchura striata TaxID=40157 RepID=A0A218VEW7_9PASE|nr:Deleted in azoospermia-like [Lonchura striata domestica]
MAAHVETQHSDAMEGSAYSAAVSQGYVLPEGKIMPNTVFVAGIDLRVNEGEIRSVFEQYGTVKEVKVITDRSGISKGYGFVSFLDNVDIQKIVEFQNVWSNHSMETYVQPPAVMNPVTQYVQLYLQPYPYNSSPTVLLKPQVPVGYQPTYNYQVCKAQPQWLAGEPRNYVMPPTPVYTSANYHGSEDTGAAQMECAAPEPVQLPSSPQKKSVDRGMQTVLSCLSNRENQLKNDFVSQDNNVEIQELDFDDPNGFLPLRLFNNTMKLMEYYFSGVYLTYPSTRKSGPSDKENLATVLIALNNSSFIANLIEQ